MMISLNKLSKNAQPATLAPRDGLFATSLLQIRPLLGELSYDEIP